MDESAETTPDTNGVERRISKLTTQKRDALDQLTELKARFAESEKRATVAESLAVRVQELESSMNRQATKHTRAMALVDAGVHDNDARDFLLHRYEKEGTDAPEFGSWLSGQRQTATGFLQDVFTSAATPQATAPPEPEAEPATGRMPPALNRGAVQTPSAQDSLSPEAILDPNRDFNEILSSMGYSLDPKKGRR